MYNFLYMLFCILKLQRGGADMRHYRIVNRTRFITFLTIIILVVSFSIGALFSRVQAGKNMHYIEVSVSQGDTLWNIAKEYGCGDKDIRRVIYDICRSNDISADELRPGQIILVPQE